MANKMDNEYLQGLVARGLKVTDKFAPNATVVEKPKPSKMRNEKTPDSEDGTMIDSKVEAAHRSQLRKEARLGEIRFYSRQPEFYCLKKDEIYRADHLWMAKDDTMHAADSKSRFTVEDKEWRAKFNRAVKGFPEVVFHVIVGKKFTSSATLPAGLP